MRVTLIECLRPSLVDAIHRQIVESFGPLGGDLRRVVDAAGAAALSDKELLILCLGAGSRTPVHAPADRLLERFGGLRELGACSAREFMQIAGIGPVFATRLEAIFEIARRHARAARVRGPRFRSSQDVYDHVGIDLRDHDREVFDVLLLDVRHRLIRHERVSTGTLTGSLVHPREVFRSAVLARAAGLIAIHNHPSGDPSPSTEDDALTQRLVSASDIMGIRLLDHVIVGDGRHFSFADAGRLERRGTSP